MEYRRLGSTDLEVSVVGFGTWTLSTGWWGDYTNAEAVSLYQKARSLGVTFFDASDSYGSGRAEEQLGQAFGEADEVVIATKVGYDVSRHAGERTGQQEISQDFSPAYIRSACEASLKRLHREHIDFYQLHNPKMDTIGRDETFACLDDLVREGKVRHYGVALGPAIGWEAEGVKAAGERDIAGLQIIYNLLEQEPGRDQIAACRERGAGIVTRVPHSSGMLEGQYTEETTFDKTDHRSHRPRSWLVNGLKKIEQLQFLLDARPRATLGQVALQWLLADKTISSTLPNIYNADQLLEFAGASDVSPLTGEELARVEDLYDANFGLEPAVENARAVGAAQWRSVLYAPWERSPTAMVSDERTYIRFAIYRLTERWRQLDASARSGSLAEFAACLEEPYTSWQQCYSLLGLRADADFCIWLKSDAGIGPLQTFERRLRATAFGRYIELTHNFISMTKPSPYARPETDADRLKLHAWPVGAPYLFVYPMVKTRAWYALKGEERGRIMRGHIDVAHKYPQIRINTSYSYGIDDQEFVVAFEGDDPGEFLDLVHDLRFSEASEYTARDTPMFTGALRTPRELAEELGAQAAVTAS